MATKTSTVDDIPFGSLNPYSNTVVIEADTVPALMDIIKKIKTPIAIRHIVSHGDKVYAILMGDIRIRRKAR